MSQTTTNAQIISHAERVALDLISRGIAVVPVPVGKKPNLRGWQLLRITAAEVSQYFGGRNINVGAIMGPASGNLTDLDLDCREAIALAPYFLPQTHSIYGRARRTSKILDELVEDQTMDDTRDPATGRFIKGHKNLPGGGRPPNAVNKITKSLREQVLEGFGDVPTFVSELKKEFPPAAAGLLARMLPPADDANGECGTVLTINVVSIPPGQFLVDEGKYRLVNHSTAKFLEGFAADGTALLDAPAVDVKVDDGDTDEPA